MGDIDSTVTMRIEQDPDFVARSTKEHVTNSTDQSLLTNSYDNVCVYKISTNSETTIAIHGSCQ